MKQRAWMGWGVGDLFAHHPALLLPAIAFATITATLGGLQMFDEPYVLTQGLGGTNNSATTLGMYLFATAFTGSISGSVRRSPGTSLLPSSC